MYTRCYQIKKKVCTGASMALTPSLERQVTQGKNRIGMMWTSTRVTAATRKHPTDRLRVTQKVNSLRAQHESHTRNDQVCKKEIYQNQHMRN